MCSIIDRDVETYRLTSTHTLYVCVCVHIEKHSLTSVPLKFSFPQNPFPPPACGMWHLQGFVAFADMKGWYLSLTDGSTCLGLQQVQTIIRDALLSCRPGEGWLLIPQMGICRNECSQRSLSGRQHSFDERKRWKGWIRSCFVRLIILKL